MFDCYISGLSCSDRKFKAVDINGAKLFNGKATMVKEVILGIMAPDTPAGNSWSPAFKADLGINAVPNEGRCTITYFDDRIGAHTGKTTPKRRLVAVPISDMSKKTEGDIAACWLSCYMK